MHLSGSMRCHPIWPALLAASVVLAGGSVHGQGGLRTILVLDSADGTPVAEVAVAVDGKPQGTTRANGELQLREMPGSHAVVRFAHVSYRTLDLPASAIPAGHALWVVKLAARNRQLGEVAVGRPRPEVVFRRPDLHAADLLINEAGVWVLAYDQPRLVRDQDHAGEEILRGVRLVLLDTMFREMASCPVPEDVIGLRQDLRHAAVIEGTRHGFGVAWTPEGALRLIPFSRDTLQNVVLPWKDSIPGLLLGTLEKRGYPEVAEVAYSPVLDSLWTFCTVTDSFMLGLLRSEYKYLNGPAKVDAMHYADELGVDKELVAAYMSGFDENVWYRPVHAPLFTVGDTVLVFDQVQWRLRKFTLALKEAGEVPLGHGKGEEGRDRTGRVLQDRATRAIHVEYARNGRVWLREVDPVHGTTGPAFTLAQPWPERIQVHAGQVYYIWRPYGSTQKRTVYRERLPGWTDRGR